MDKNLVRRLNRLNGLTDIIFNALKLSPTRHSLWVTQDNHCLNIVTSDSILATKIRMDSPNIIKHVNDNSCLIIRSIKVKLSHIGQAKAPKENKTLPISEAAAQNITLIANTIEDKGLREGLLSIANTKIN